MKKEALLYDCLPAGKVQCKLCAHHCVIPSGEFGKCGVRQNVNGILYTYTYGDIVAQHVDPIEKKPLYHCLPGSLTYSIATLGCNFKCGFCQNWQISQETYTHRQYRMNQISPQTIVQDALRYECLSIAYTYTEPTVFFEYAMDTGEIAKQQGLLNIFVTNGYMSPETIKECVGWVDAVNIDLKSFYDTFYRTHCQASVKPVLDSIKAFKSAGVWVELTTLLIPGINDGDEEIALLAQFIAGIGKEIPWHISAFHPDYQYRNINPTSEDSLQRAAKIGKEHGLWYVYIGNVMDEIPTVCYHCKQQIVSRQFFSLRQFDIHQGCCRFCGAQIHGIW